MKKILFTIIGLSALFCMSSCDEAVYKGRKVYKAYFDYTLKDPESFKVYSEKYTVFPMKLSVGIPLVFV